MTAHPWILKGGREDILSPIRAFFIAPLFALAPIILSFAIKTYSDRLPTAEEVIAIGFFTLLTAYGTTLFIGIPWYLLLARLGYAGLIPMMFSSAFPPAFVYLRALGHNYTDTNLFAGLFFICGLLISAAFWKIARTE
jgi:hypothetical protein